MRYEIDGLTFEVIASRVTNPLVRGEVVVHRRGSGTSLHFLLLYESPMIYENTPTPCRDIFDVLKEWVDLNPKIKTSGFVPK